MPIRPENRDRYPDDWDEIAHRIKFVRAQGWCECPGNCGRTTHTGPCPNRHGYPDYDTGKNTVLTTAHLNHIPEDVRDDNLAAYCAPCHLTYDAAHHAQTRARTRAAELAATGQHALFTLEP